MVISHKQVQLDEICKSYSEYFDKSKFEPTFDANGRQIKGSLQIAIYLELSYPERILFNTEFTTEFCGRLEIQFESLQKTIKKHLKEYYDLLSSSNFTGDQVNQHRTDGQEIAYNQFSPLFSRLEQSNFLGGSAPIYLDYLLFSNLEWLTNLGYFSEISHSVSVYDWRDNCRELLKKSNYHKMFQTKQDY